MNELLVYQLEIMDSLMTGVKLLFTSFLVLLFLMSCLVPRSQILLTLISIFLLKLVLSPL